MVVSLSLESQGRAPGFAAAKVERRLGRPTRRELIALSLSATVRSGRGAAESLDTCRVANIMGPVAQSFHDVGCLQMQLPICVGANILDR